MLRRTEFIGHQSIIESLAIQVANKELAHTYIFSGAPNIGKSFVSQWFMEAIACENNASDQAGCGQCRNCQSLNAAVTPALITLSPDAKAQSISIEAVRETKANLKLGLGNGLKRFVIVDKAESLTESAANSLLKLIEEPPANTYIILLTSVLNSLPATIISRGQVIHFKRVLTEQLKEAAKAYTSINANIRKEIAHAADGRPGLMLKWLNNQDDFDNYKERARALANQLAQPNIIALDMIEEYFTDSGVSDSGSQILLTIIRDSVNVQSNRNKFAINQFILPTLKKISQRYRHLTTLADRAIQLNRDIRANVNVKLAVENYFIQATNDIN